MSVVYTVEFERKAVVCEDDYNSVVGIYSTWKQAIRACKLIKTSQDYDEDRDSCSISIHVPDIMPKKEDYCG